MIFLHERRKSGDFISRNDSQPTKLKRRCEILQEVSSREFYDWKLYGLNALIIWSFHLFKKIRKNQKSILWVDETITMNQWFIWPSLSSSVLTNVTPELTTPQEIGVGTYVYVWHGSITVPVCLLADEGAIRLLLLSSCSLLSCSTVRPENTYS